MILTNASRQWSERPSDEKYWSLSDMREACHLEYQAARQTTATLGDLSTVAVDEEVMLVGSSGVRSLFSNYSFGQFVRTVAPKATDYLRTLPPELASRNLNHGLAQINGTQRNLLFTDEDPVLRLKAIASNKYSRIWNVDVLDRLMRLESRGWRVPPARPSRAGDERARPATESDCLSDRSFDLSVKPGDMIAPAGLYASDHDMFAFMIHEHRDIEVGGHSYMRGFFATNSEVPGTAFKLVCFLFNKVCGNHIVWDAREVKEMRVVHMGQENAAAGKAFDGIQVQVQVQEYADESASLEEARIRRAYDHKIADTKDEVLNKVFGLGTASRKDIEAAYGLAEQHPEDGHQGADTAWGMVQGLTRLSQETPFADRRNQLDRAAGKVAQIAF